MPEQIRKPVAQNQGDASSDIAPRSSLSLLAREEFGDDFHGEVEETPPKRPPESDEPQDPERPDLPEIPDEDVEEGGENKRIEGDETEDAASTPEAAETDSEPIATVRELVEHLEADPSWFTGLKVDVVVDGNTSQVPLKELIDNYQIREAADERLAQAKTKSQQAQQELAERNTAIDLQYEQAAKLVLMQEKRLTDDVAAINWDQLKREDPALYAAHRQDVKDRQDQIQQAKQQTLWSYQQVRATREQEHQDQKAVVMQEQSQLLMEAMPRVSPDWGDPQKAPQAKHRLSTYLLGQGFAHKEIEDTLDHRAFVVAEKARLWDESQKKLQVTKKRIQSVPKVMKPGAGKEPSTVNLERVRNAQKQLRDSGRQADAMALLRARRKTGG